jgi:hypothetical protein
VPDKRKSFIDAIAPEATSQDVINFALARFSRQLSLWGLACIKRDEDGMRRATAEIKNIAVKMDRFRRITVKRWRAAAPPNSQTEQPKV